MHPILAEIFGPDLIIVIIVAAIVIFGGSRIPKLARSLGSAQSEFKKGMAEGAAGGEQQETTPPATPPATPEAGATPSSPSVPGRPPARRGRTVADDVLTTADKLWRGEIDIASLHPVGGYMGGLAEPCDGVAFVPSFANVSAFYTEDGLVFVDTGSVVHGAAIHDQIRRWSATGSTPLSTPMVTSTTCSVSGSSTPRPDSGVGRRRSSWRTRPCPLASTVTCPPPVTTSVINRAPVPEYPGSRWPTDYRYPDRTYRPTRPGGGRDRLRASPRQGRDRRPHLDLGARAPGPLLR